ncbi:hypothetical protein G4B88_025564 [Cannabis sativa]|uniref:Uncharacterized protein n=1 Tax=Cannabis sativa TaxID=3483 RepID=A0A7J6F2G5_CANSA|nr:hypothetical protein G4B88_025564 [Cannabis sativa]
MDDDESAFGKGIRVEVFAEKSPRVVEAAIVEVGNEKRVVVVVGYLSGGKYGVWIRRKKTKKKNCINMGSSQF